MVAAPETFNGRVSGTSQRFRHFNAAWQAAILTAADACTNPGELGALLRRLTAALYF